MEFIVSEKGDEETRAYDAQDFHESAIVPGENPGYDHFAKHAFMYIFSRSAKAHSSTLSHSAIESMFKQFFMNLYSEL